MSTRTDAIVCFGKVPTHGDFLRYGTDGELARALDEWVQQGLYIMKTRADPSIGNRFDAGPSYSFCYHDPVGPQALIGVLQPSRDRVGRRYPLIVAREVESNDAVEWARTPVHFAPFLKEAADLAEHAVAGHVDYREIESAVDAIIRSNGMPGSAHTASFTQYLETTLFKSLAIQNWGYYEDARKYLVFKNLLDLGAAAQDRGASLLTQGIKLPLGGASGVNGHEAAFWLSVCGRLIDADWNQATLFWRVGAAPDEHALFVFPKGPPSAGFVSLFAGSARTPAAEEVLDVQEMGRDQGVAAVLSLPARYGDLLEDDSLSLAHLLHRL